ncbi:MAG: PilZ domain-containing protein [Myxococcaceae bacterium]|nr:PilZ domain-containing protein [Myxococcaceae bacterium]
MSSSLDERRQHPRHRVFRVEVKVASAESFRASYLRDLSSGGLFVRSAKPLPPQTRVVVQLSIADGQPLSLPGQVARVAEGGFGVRFDPLTPEQQTGVEALIGSAKSRQDGDLAAALAEARGHIEAYEQNLALLREAEMDANQRAENLELERSVLAEAVKDLTARLAAVETDRERLRALIDRANARLKAFEGEATRSEERHRAELEQVSATAARATQEQAAAAQLLATQLAQERAATGQLRKELERELNQLKAGLTSGENEQRLRAELQELASQLDDERLKALAFQRALERFVAMGGLQGPP